MRFSLEQQAWVWDGHAHCSMLLHTQETRQQFEGVPSIPKFSFAFKGAWTRCSLSGLSSKERLFVDFRCCEGLATRSRALNLSDLFCLACPVMPRGCNTERIGVKRLEHCHHGMV